MFTPKVICLHYIYRTGTGLINHSNVVISECCRAESKVSKWVYYADDAQTVTTVSRTWLQNRTVYILHFRFSFCWAPAKLSHGYALKIEHPKSLVLNITFAGVMG